MLHFTIQELSGEQLAAAWPLVRNVAPTSDARRWIATGRRLIQRGGGILGVATEEGFLHGLATYEPVDKAPIGKVLRVDTLVTFELSRRAPVRRALYNALERLAAALGCTAVIVGVANRGYLPEVQKRSAAANDRKFPSDR